MVRDDLAAGGAYAAGAGCRGHRGARGTADPDLRRRERGRPRTGPPDRAAAGFRRRHGADRDRRRLRHPADRVGDRGRLLVGPDRPPLARRAAGGVGQLRVRHDPLRRSRPFRRPVHGLRRDRGDRLRRARRARGAVAGAGRGRDPRGGGVQGGPGSVRALAFPRHGRPDAGLGALALGDDGRGGGLPAGAAPARAGRGAGFRRGGHGGGSRDRPRGRRRGAAPDARQEAARRLHLGPDGPDDRYSRGGLSGHRDPAPRGPRGVQGRAVRLGRRGAPRQRRLRPSGDVAWPGDAVGRGRDGSGGALARGGAAACRRLV